MSETSEAPVGATTDLLTETPEGVTFADLGLSASLLKTIEDTGYTKPTPIQWRAIPEVLKGRDVLGIAQTGTGKTASFVLPMIEMLSQGRAKARMPRTLILEPTRELAAQVAENFEKYGKNHKLTMALLIGGVSFGDQDALLMKGVDVLIATPGRLLDQFERGKILMSQVQLLVIDEADRMLDMGFIPDIEKIAKMTPFTRQTLFFSATMPPEISNLADQFLHTPVRVEVARPAQTASTIEQFLVKSKYNDPKNKRAILRNIIAQEMAEMKNGIIFCNRKKDVDIVAKSLNAHGIDAAPIHGDLQQNVRTATLDKFRAGDLKILVASDVAARGLDVPDVSHVFNFDVPSHAEDYVHRIGRTGRAGRSGKTYMLATPYDDKHLDGVLALIKSEIPLLETDVGQNSEPSYDTKPARERSSTGRNNAKRGEKSFADKDARKGPKPNKTDDNIASGEAQDSYEKPIKAKYFEKNEKPRFENNRQSKKPQPKHEHEKEEFAPIIGFGDDLPAFMKRPSIREVPEFAPIEEAAPLKIKPTRARRPSKAKAAPVEAEVQETA